MLSVASRALLEACEGLGLDTGALLAAAGLERAVVMDPDARIPAERADSLWVAASEAASDPHLALHAAQALPFGAYKVLDYIVAHAPTVGEGLDRIARYFPLVDSCGVLCIEAGDPLRMVMRSELGPVPPPAQEYTLAAIVLRSRASFGTPWRLEAVELAFDAPSDASEHERIFECPVRFGCPEPALLVPRESFERASEGSEPALLSVLEDHAHRLLAELPPDEPALVGRVRRLLAQELRGGDASIENLARRLGLGARTLQRRLDAHGVRFTELLAEVRTAHAREYLRDPGLSLAEVAWLLGFSDQSAFSRAFKRATGQPPGAWRSAHASA